MKTKSCAVRLVAAWLLLVCCAACLRAGFGAPLEEELRCQDDADCAQLDRACLEHVCDQRSGACAPAPLDDGAACDDGLDCTVGDQCDGEGACVGAPDDDRCVLSGQICRPDWFPGPLGCGLPPTRLQLVCDDQVAVNATAQCVVALDGLPGQAGTLSCTAHAGIEHIDHSTFTSADGECADQGWELATGASCTESVTGCVPGGATITCCDDFDTICEGGWFGGALLADISQSCGGGFKQWRLSRSFDTRGAEELSLCFEVAEAYATVDDAIIVEVTDGTNASQLTCVQGDINWRGGNQSRCHALPSWSADKPVLTVSVIAHINALVSPDPRRMNFGRTHLWGWRPGCDARQRAALLSEDFTGCADPLPTTFNGWSVSGAATCRASVSCSGEGTSLSAAQDEVELIRTIDTSALSGDLLLCFDAGDVGAEDSDRISAHVDVGDGEGWRWAGSGSPYPMDQSCERVCFNLSSASPLVARNRSLRLRVRLSSGAAARRVLLDNLELSGLHNCPAAGLLELSALTDVGGGVYVFTVGDQTGGPISAEVVCGWEQHTTPLMAVEQIRFK